MSNKIFKLKTLLGLSLTFIFIGFNLSANAQGIDYPGNVPANSGGAGNARTDADNLFTRNNPAALTEIENDDVPNKKSNWRVMTEFLP